MGSPVSRNGTPAWLPGRKPELHIAYPEDEIADVEDFIRNLESASRTKLSQNILGRALFRLAMEAEEEIREAIKKNPPRRRPANNDLEGIALFEDEWQSVVREGLRRLKVR